MRKQSCDMTWRDVKREKKKKRTRFWRTLLNIVLHNDKRHYTKYIWNVQILTNYWIPRYGTVVRGRPPKKLYTLLLFGTDITVRVSICMFMTARRNQFWVGTTCFKRGYSGCLQYLIKVFRITVQVDPVKWGKKQCDCDKTDGAQGRLGENTLE